MRRTILAMAVGVAWTLYLLGGVVGQAAEPSLAAGIDRLFQVGWERSAQARQDARLEYDRLKQSAHGDARVDYAYALVQLQQLRYAEAAELLGGVLAAEKDHLVGWQLKAWLSVLTKDHDKALLEFQRVAELLASDAAAPASAAARGDAASLLGRLFGFLEGPAAGNVNAVQLAAARRRVAERLDPEAAPLFEEGREDVLGAYRDATRGVEEGQATAEVQAAEEKERKLAELAAQGEAASADAAAAQERFDYLRKEIADELNEIDKRQRVLVAELQRLDIEAGGVRRDLALVDDRVAYLYALADAEEDPVRRQMYYNEAARWQLNRNHYLPRLAEIQRRASVLTAEGTALEQRGRAAQLRLNQEAGRLAQIQRGVDRVRQQADRVAGQRITGLTPQVLHQRRVTAALTSYVPLPISLEAEKRRLIDSMR